LHILFSRPCAAPPVECAGLRATAGPLVTARCSPAAGPARDGGGEEVQGGGCEEPGVLVDAGSAPVVPVAGSSPGLARALCGMSMSVAPAGRAAGGRGERFAVAGAAARGRRPPGRSL